MLKTCALTALATVVSGCVVPWSAQKQKVDWPDEASTQLIAPSMEAGAALAAAAAIRELVKTNKDPRLFKGCSSPEQGMNVSVFKHPASGLFYVVLEQRFDRCGGPSGRVLDWWHEYAVTAQGEVLAEAPPTAGEAPAPTAPPEPTPPSTPPPEKSDTPTPAPPALSPQSKPEAPPPTP